MEENILIIGGGAAGLRAAQALVHTGVSVTLLEARDRLGGRILTWLPQPDGLPVELGAEFIHGAQNSAWDIVHAAKLRTQAVPDRHWRVVKGKMQEVKDCWKELGDITERINPSAPDQDLQSFLDQGWSLDPSAKRFTREYVEGFHAAPANRMSIHALVKAEQAAERDEATRAFRLTRGYSALIDWLAADLQPPRASIHLNTVVQAVRWAPGRVEVVAKTQSGPRQFHAPRAICTLPLGVLQAQDAGAVRFEPELLAKKRAIQGLGMGSVVKITLQFRSRFWPVNNFGFIHSEDRWFPTWWSDQRGPFLTGWAGGTRAEQLNRASNEAIEAEAINTLARVFQIEAGRIRESLVGAFHHNWSTDPFSRGAYSFTPVRMMGMSQRLGTAVGNTLFFAGEATAPDGEQGTVHAALASGQRAAEEILATLTSNRLPPAPPEIAAAA